VKKVEIVGTSIKSFECGFGLSWWVTVGAVTKVTDFWKRSWNTVVNYQCLDVTEDVSVSIVG